MPTTSTSSPHGRPDGASPAGMQAGSVQEVRLGRTVLRPDSELFHLDPSAERRAGPAEIQRADGILLDTGPSHDMPYARVVVRVGDGARAEAAWSGTAPRGRSVSMWAQETGQAGAWRLLTQAEGGGAERIELRAPIPVDLLHHRDDGGTDAHLLVLGQDPFAAPVRAAEPGFDDPSDYDFAILHLSDTQHLAEGAAQTRDQDERERFQASIDAITQWIADNARRRKIVYAVHTGDVIQHWCWWWDRRAVAEREFAVASEMFTALERIGLPYGVLPGNHDNRWGSDDQEDGAAPELSLWNGVFGPQRARRAAADWAPTAGEVQDGAPRVVAERGETWRPDDSSCHYDLLTIGRTRLLLLHLGYGIEDEHIEWANQVLQDHADRDAILCTHHFLDEGTLPDGSGAPWGGPRSFGPDDGVRIQERIVARNANVVLVLSGHISGTGWRVDRADPAHPTTAVLADYQAHRLLGDEDSNGDSDGRSGVGGQDADAAPVAQEQGARQEPRGELRTGFLRLLQFRAEAGEMRVSTYSPVLDSFDPDRHAPTDQLERLRSGAGQDSADYARPAPQPPEGGWADPHQLVLPVSLRSRTTWLQTDRLGVDEHLEQTPSAGTEPEAAGSPTPQATALPWAGTDALTNSEDAHGVVRPDRWGTVLTAAGALAVGMVVRGLRRR
ncbi:metallophosphoesterase [Kocuria palustris]|uniref:metallophosphoesterase n=1 Tax=Kocuria palustris TaxID=71999 RepID=UPI0024692D47|nr:metallophosphoesterase [Kocuria palustris]MDH5151614.1 metallophosphoesterase [Kocuria palustris]